MADKRNNTGADNSGNWNSGNWNSGNWNSGDRNSGDWNSGNWNSGDRNSGYWNSGNWNSGDWNSGNWNSGNWNSGYFNTDEPKVRIFNKETSVRREEIDFPDYMYFDLCYWVSWDNMSDEAKKEDPDAYIRGGQLIIRDYKEVWQEAWAGASAEEKQKTKELPNFDADIFYEITGIRVDSETYDKKQKLLSKADELIAKAKEMKAEAEKL